jgi:RND family efflux transporter MFP subunit
VTKKAFVTGLTLTLVMAASAVITGCGQANSEPGVQSEVIKPVKLYQVPLNLGENYDSFLAEVDAGERSQLSFQVPGAIEKLNVRQGVRVKKNQVLAELDDSDYQLAVDAAQAQYELAITRYKRDKQLFEKKLISTDAFDQSETSFKSANANLEAVKADLGYTKIKAPFDGLISQRFVETHQFVGANQPIFNIINNDRLDINISLPVPYVEKTGIRELPEKEFSVVFDIQSSVFVPARFKEMSTQPEPDTNSFNATVTIERPSHLNILTGMTGEVFIANQGQQERIELPDNAWVSTQADQGTVWKFDANTNTVSLLTVTLDQSGSVISGLKPGDRVVIAGTDDLHEGQTVKAWQREGGI